MSAVIRQIVDYVKDFWSPLIPLIILQKNSQRFGLSRGNAGFSTAAPKNYSERQRRITARTASSSKKSALLRAATVRCNSGPRGPENQQNEPRALT
jgi:hypothetical protein